MSLVHFGRDSRWGKSGGGRIIKLDLSHAGMKMTRTGAGAELTKASLL